ncbi:MAG: glycerol-3-phosphate 1-O-acyltransferase PlsY [Candidatus Eremiobacteraeota bacterium]|nr:glycerol-3-phosphate 1-O-acyltransferase PlsY [Candidatus Eremiobacteraeota bacterium]
MNPLLALLTAVVSFFIGSIPFGYLIGRFFYRTDLRKSGSGNIGAMNALRTLGKAGAITVLILDALKGAIPVLIALHVLHSDAYASIAATFAVLGHCYSPWLGWKGGKGVATSFGAIFALSWPAGFVVVLGWVLGALVLTRYSSVGSMLANIVAPFALFYFTRSWAEAAYGVFAALFIMWTHRENIGRLRTGTENRISLSRKAS